MLLDSPEEPMLKTPALSVAMVQPLAVDLLRGRPPLTHFDLLGLPNHGRFCILFAEMPLAVLFGPVAGPATTV